MYKIAIVNQKGGVGKSTITVNLAYELGKEKKVLYIITFSQENFLS